MIRFRSEETAGYLEKYMEQKVFVKDSGPQLQINGITLCDIYAINVRPTVLLLDPIVKYFTMKINNMEVLTAQGI